MCRPAPPSRDFFQLAHPSEEAWCSLSAWPFADVIAKANLSMLDSHPAGGRSRTPAAAYSAAASAAAAAAPHDETQPLCDGASTSFRGSWEAEESGSAAWTSAFIRAVHNDTTWSALPSGSVGRYGGCSRWFVQPFSNKTQPQATNADGIIPRTPCVSQLCGSRRSLQWPDTWHDASLPPVEEVSTSRGLRGGPGAQPCRSYHYRRFVGDAIVDLNCCGPRCSGWPAQHLARGRTMVLHSRGARHT
eukprot:3416719-Prymnesium_polylepis.2